MYCKYCGEHNANDQSYCQNCGNMIKTNTITLDKVTITESKTAFCKKCGTAVFDRYCTECGTVGYNLERKTGAKVPEIGINLGSIDDIKSKIQNSALGDIRSVDDVKNMVASKPILKSSFISAAKILGIGLLISLLIFGAITKIGPVQSIMTGIDRASSFGYHEISKLKPSFIDLFNLSLQSPINMSANVQGDLYGEKIASSAKMVMSFKILILLLIPIIAVLISQWKLFKDENSSTENLMDYGVTSLLFSIMAKILAVITQKTVKINDPGEFLKFKLSIGLHDLWSLLSVFLIIFAVQVLISMIMKKDNPFELLNISQYPDLGNRIKTYVKSMGIFSGIISIAIILIVIIIGSKEGGEAKYLTMFGLVMAPAVFIHTWLFSMGNNMATVATGTKPVSINIWKTWKGIGSLKDYNYGGSGSWAIWGYIFMIAIFLGLVYVIYRVVKDIEDEEYFKKLGFIAGSISIINILLSGLVNVGLKMSNKAAGDFGIGDILYQLDLGFLRFMTDSGALKQSYTILSIIVTTFIWVFAIGAIIYYLREKDVYYTAISFVEEYGQKLVIGYSALILVSLYLFQAKILEDVIMQIFNLFPMMDMFL